MNPATTNHASVRASRLRIAAILGSLSAFGPLSIDMYLPALPSLSSHLHTSASLAQLSVTMCLVGLALGQLLAGPLSDARGRRLPLLVGISVYIVASLLCAVSPSIWLLVGLRFLQGLSGSAGIVISRAVARDLYSGSELTRFFALLMLVNGVAPILAPVIGGQLLRFTSWRGVFLVLGILGLAMGISVLFGLPETLAKNGRSSGGLRLTMVRFGALLSDRLFMGYALSQGLVSAAMFAYIAGSPFVLQDIFGLTPQMFSVVFATNGLGIIITSQLAGRLAHNVDQVKLFRYGIGFAGCGGIALFLSVLFRLGLPAILPSLFVVVSSVGIVSTMGSALAMQEQAKLAGSASAMIGVSQLLLGGLASPLVGIAGSHAALPMGVVIIAADLGAIVWYMAMTRRKRAVVRV